MGDDGEKGNLLFTMDVEGGTRKANGLRVVAQSTIKEQDVPALLLLPVVVCILCGG